MTIKTFTCQQLAIFHLLEKFLRAASSFKSLKQIPQTASYFFYHLQKEMFLIFIPGYEVQITELCKQT